VGSLVCLGRRTLSRIIWTNGDQQRSWGSEYFLHSRCRWEPQRLFTPILKRALPYCTGRYIGVAADDTRLHKTGRCIEQAFFQRDPLSPPFHVNLMLGLRFLQASLLVPLYRRSKVGTRALPIRFQEASRVKRPGRKAPAEDWKLYRAAARQYNLSQKFVTMMKDLRLALDSAGASLKILVMAVDGSFCNRTVFAALVKGVEIIARARKDASVPWQECKLFYGGKRRRIRFKDLNRVYWQGGARKRTLRLLVVAPTPYRKRSSGRF
jgi:hypothetical protein